MLGKRDGKELRTVAGTLLSVLLGLAVFVGWGCTSNPFGAPGVDSTGTVPSHKSEAALQAQIEKKFESPQAHYELAQIYHKNHEWTKAEYEYTTALGFDPGNTGAQAGLVKLFFDRGEKAKGDQYADKYVTQAVVSADESLRLGWEFDKIGQDNYALRCFRQALEMSPNSAEVNKQVGLYYLGKGDTAKAKDYLSRSFQANPNQPDVAGALGRLGVVVQAPQEPEPPRVGTSR